MPRPPSALTRDNIVSKPRRTSRYSDTDQDRDVVRPRKPRQRERQLIMDLPGTSPAPQLRHAAPHQSGSIVSHGRPTFASPPLLPGLVDQIRILLGTKAKPTPVQSLSLSHFFHNSRVGAEQSTLLAAETGSGKSLAYLLPVIQALKATESTPQSDNALPAPRALILVPTHELARQVKATLSHLTHAPDTKLRSVCVSSGTSASLAGRDINMRSTDIPSDSSGEFRIEAPSIQGTRSADVVVGTPAKILDLTRTAGRHSVGPKRPGDEESARREFQREVRMSLSAIEWIVVDEADVLFGACLASSAYRILITIHQRSRLFRLDRGYPPRHPNRQSHPILSTSQPNPNNCNSLRPTFFLPLRTPSQPHPGHHTRPTPPPRLAPNRARTLGQTARQPTPDRAAQAPRHMGGRGTAASKLARKEQDRYLL
jgi:ATP-dependent RNA helicase MRH4